MGTKVKLSSVLVVLSILVLRTSLSNAQDPGIRDTLKVLPISPFPANSTELKVEIRGFHDELLVVQVIPLKFAPMGADIRCDSVIFGPDILAIPPSMRVSNCDGVDTCVINNNSKVLFIWWISFGAPLSTGEHLIATAYFSTGATWVGEAVIDTITYGYASLAFTDNETAMDIVPYYNNEGKLYVRRPVLDSIGQKSVTEGDTLSFGVIATDSSGIYVPTLKATNLPANSYLADSGNGRGVFTFTPAFNQAGEYFVNLIATNPVFADTEVVRIAVNCGKTLRGDVSGDGYITMIDIFYFINLLFKHGPAPVLEECDGDTDNNGRIGISDLIHLINYLFREGPAPSPTECCI